MSWVANDVLMLSENDEAGRHFTYSYDSNDNIATKTQIDTTFTESWV